MQAEHGEQEFQQVNRPRIGEPTVLAPPQVQHGSHDPSAGGQGPHEQSTHNAMDTSVVPVTHAPADVVDSPNHCLPLELISRGFADFGAYLDRPVA